MNITSPAICICNKMETKPNEFKRCSRCKIAKYCSAECQKQDWETCHKIDCGKNMTPEGQKFIKLLNEDINNITKANIIVYRAREFYIEQIKYDKQNNIKIKEETQQVVLCEVEKDTYKLNFDVINQEGIDNPPDNVIKRHLEQGTDKFLIFIHDLNSNLLTTYQLSKISKNELMI